MAIKSHGSDAMDPSAASPPIPRRASPRNLAAGFLVLLLSAAMIPFELPLWLALYRGLLQYFPPLSNPSFGDIGLFSDIIGLALCVLLIALFDRRHRNLLPHLVIAAALAYGTNHVLKEISGRARPLYVFPVEALPRGTSYDTQLAVDIARGAESWHPVWTPRPRPYTPVRSFPSGHAATAIVMAWFLSLLYRRLAVLWWCIAIAVALTRFLYLWHFPSDVIFSSAVGWIFAQYVFAWHWPLKLIKPRQ